MIALYDACFISYGLMLIILDTLLAPMGKLSVGLLQPPVRVPKVLGVKVLVQEAIEALEPALNWQPSDHRR